MEGCCLNMVVEYSLTRETKRSKANLDFLLFYSRSKNLKNIFIWSLFCFFWYPHGISNGQQILDITSRKWQKLKDIFLFRKKHCFEPWNIKTGKLIETQDNWRKPKELQSLLKSVLYRYLQEQAVRSKNNKICADNQLKSETAKKERDVQRKYENKIFEAKKIPKTTLQS